MFDTDDSPFHNDPATPPSARSLNARQEAFCQFYVRGSSAARAARLAGYGAAGAKNQGYRLLQEDRVRDRLNILREALRDERDARERDWMDRLAAIGRQALAEGALHPAIRAIEAEARIMKLEIGAKVPDAGDEERQAAEEAELAQWVRRGEANIARCLASMEADGDG